MKRYGLLVVMVLMVVGLIGCSTTKDNDSAANANTNAAVNEADEQVATTNNEEAPESESESKATVYPLTVKDATGKEFIFSEAPQRIVSTSVSETEILFALGLGDQVVGVSDYDNYPAEVLDKPKVGGVTNPNVEVIIASNADLVIAGISMKAPVVEEFRALNVNLFKTDPENMNDILDSILLFGLINDKQLEAEAIVAQMREDIRKVTEAVATLKPEEKKKVYIEFSPGWTVGKGEFMDELITMAGGMNIASDLEGWNAINEEKIIADNPDVIIYPLNLMDTESGKLMEDLIPGRSGWDKITAIVENRMIGVDADTLSRTGPRVTQGLLDIFRGIYPELAKE
jgi:iron complex transport system substrate-binding protein